jgi:hypothetical protein
MLITSVLRFGLRPLPGTFDPPPVDQQQCADRGSFPRYPQMHSILFHEDVRRIDLATAAILCADMI